MYTWIKNKLHCLWFGHEKFTKPQWYRYEINGGWNGYIVDIHYCFLYMKTCKRCGDKEVVDKRGHFEYPKPKKFINL